MRYTIAYVRLVRNFIESMFLYVLIFSSKQYRGSTFIKPLLLFYAFVQTLSRNKRQPQNVVKEGKHLVYTNVVNVYEQFKIFKTVHHGRTLN